jgi:hypothetical protein
LPVVGQVVITRRAGACRLRTPRQRARSTGGGAARSGTRVPRRCVQPLADPAKRAAAVAGMPVIALNAFTSLACFAVVEHVRVPGLTEWNGNVCAIRNS